MTYQDATRHRYSVPGQEYLITFCTAHRQPVFNELYRARALVAALKTAVNREWAHLLCWVIMPDHIHLLMRLGEVHSLSGVTGRMKIEASNRAAFRIPWQKGFHDRMLRKEEDRVAMARYIIMNPVRARLVGSIREYPHWDSVYFQP